MNDGGVLGCENCKRRCCGYSGVQNKVITIFNGETGSNPTGDFVQEMELIDSKCKFLMDDGLCSIYLDPNRSVTCKFYPVVVDIYDNMYLSSTCPDYGKVIERLISGDKDTIEYFKKLYLDIIKVDPKIKDFWTDMVAEWPILICINPFVSFNIQKIERKWMGKV